MSEEARDKLRKGLDLLWRGFAKEKETHRGTQDAYDYLKKIEEGLNDAEDLLNTGRVREAAEAGMRAGDLLATLDLRVAIALFRESNKLQREKQQERIRSTQQKVFFIRASHLLDQAEAMLDDGNIEEAREILGQYHREKVIAGLTGPVG